VLLPGRFIGVDGLSAVQTGQLMIALSAPLLVVPMLAAWLSRWFTAGVLSALGLALNALGLLWMSEALVAGPQALVLPMLLVGVGIGLPWGLMDGLAVSVVEKERAGMATGIFNTVRVSGDGVAIALVGALLAALMLVALPASAVAPSQLVAAASHAALGDLAQAAAMLGVDRAALLPGYDAAFRTLLQVLAAVTGLTAVLVFALLGRVRPHELEAAEEVPCEA
jgi:Na+/melibiose symporter-like transporter